MKSFSIALGFLIAIALAFWTGTWFGTWAGTLTKTPHPTAENPLPSQSPPLLFPASLPLSETIYNATGHQVFAFNPDNHIHQTALSIISQAASEACEHFNQADSSTKGIRRINEASKHFEDFLQIRLDASSDFSCQFAKTATGSSQRSGYPDLHLIHIASGTHFYLDPKLYEKTSEHSSLRTFYYSPNSKKQKIQHDATHLLIGFSHDGNDGDWNFLGRKVVDLASLTLTLKSEYNASNKELYEANRILMKD